LAVIGTLWVPTGLAALNSTTKAVVRTFFTHLEGGGVRSTSWSWPRS
jgi:hypothetical protein